MTYRYTLDLNCGAHRGPRGASSAYRHRALQINLRATPAKLLHYWFVLVMMALRIQFN